MILRFTFQEVSMENIEAYCVKCKKKGQMKDEEQVTLKNGRIALKGKCKDCGTSMFRILKTK